MAIKIFEPIFFLAGLSGSSSSTNDGSSSSRWDQGFNCA